MDVGFTYDQGLNGIGRLTTMRDGSGTTSYQYDLRGNIIEMQTTPDGLSHTMGYACNGADQVMSITYPSGRTVDYQRNGLGQISGVTTTLNGETQTLASTMDYAPFGPMTGLTFGNDIPLSRELDQDYRLAANVHQGVLEQGYTFDAADNIAVIANNLDLTRDQSFGYDALNRLTAASGVYGATSHPERSLSTLRTGTSTRGKGPSTCALALRRRSSCSTAPYTLGRTVELEAT